MKWLVPLHSSDIDAPVEINSSIARVPLVGVWLRPPRPLRQQITRLFLEQR